MALPDLTGQNIEDTYQRVLQVDNNGSIRNGTGSLFLPPSASYAITASHAISASHEITYELSSSHAETASMASGDFLVQGNITASGNISASGDISATNVSASILRISNPSYTGNLRFYQDSDNSYKLVSNIGNIFDFGNLNVITTNQRIDGVRGTIIKTHKESDPIKFRDFDANDIIVVDNSGSLTLGNTSAHKPYVTINTDLTASGNISASGNLIGANISGSGLFISGAGGVTVLGNRETSGSIKFFDNDLQGHIEMSVKDNHVGTELSGIFAGRGYEGNETGYLGWTNVDLGSQNLAMSARNFIYLQSNGNTIATVKDFGFELYNNKRLIVNSHITASGNISSSGTIEGSILGGTLSTPIQTGITQVGTLTTLTVDNLKLNGNTLSSTSDSDVFISLGSNGIGFNASDNDTFTFNSSQNNADLQFTGENDLNLFYIDTSEDKIGIGTNTPGEKLEVIGNISASLTGSFKHLKATTIEGNSPLTIKDLSSVTFNNADLYGNPIFHGDVNVYSGSAFLDQYDHDIFRSNATTQAVGHLTFGGNSINTHILGTSIIHKNDTILSGSVEILGNFTGSINGGTF